MTPSPSCTQPDAITWRETTYRTLLPAAAAQGRQSVIDSVTQPGGGLPRHLHRDADETFVLLSGDVAVWLTGETYPKGPGDVVFIPRGTEHTFQVVGARPARMLTILSPGGFEGFFAEMARGGLCIPQDMTAVTAIAERYHLSFTGSPLMLGNEQEQGNA